MNSPPRLDWSVGSYEQTAEQLLPAARVAVDRAAPAKGEHVVDVACGTGNASLLAAAGGTRVTGAGRRGAHDVWVGHDAQRRAFAVRDRHRVHALLGHHSGHLAELGIFEQLNIPRCMRSRLRFHLSFVRVR